MEVFHLPGFIYNETTPRPQTHTYTKISDMVQFGVKPGHVPANRRKRREVITHDFKSKFSPKSNYTFLLQGTPPPPNLWPLQCTSKHLLSPSCPNVACLCWPLPDFGLSPTLLTSSRIGCCWSWQQP